SLSRFVGCGRTRSPVPWGDRKSTRLNSSHRTISYAVFCLKKKKHYLKALAFTPAALHPDLSIVPAAFAAARNTRAMHHAPIGDDRPSGADSPHIYPRYAAV